jgi:hypothetical protein
VNRRSTAIARSAWFLTSAGLLAAGCGRADIYAPPAPVAEGEEAPLPPVESLWELGPVRSLPATSIIADHLDARAGRRVASDGTTYFLRIGVLGVSQDMPLSDAAELLKFARNVKDRSKVESIAVEQAYARWQRGPFYCEFELGQRKWTFGEGDATFEVEPQRFFEGLDQLIKDAEAMADADPSLEL